MGFFEIFTSLNIEPTFDFSPREVGKTLGKENLSERDFLVLLSPAAEYFLEEMAQRAHRETVQYFGRTIRIYTPLYLSDFCDNTCVYCGFNRNNPFPRKRLSLEEVQREGEAISKKGFQDLLVLTGESRTFTPASYLAQACEILYQYFPALSVEVYPLKREEYEALHCAGVNGLTIYQETYNARLYDVLHPSGPKKNFRFRLEAPERGGEARLRWINIGVLLGLDNWRKDVFFLGLHARYLMERFPHCEIGVGIPRLRPHFGIPLSPQMVSDRNVVQIICALRLFLPRLGISLTTREEPEFRNNLIPLGITRMSAGSITSVGGHDTTNKDNIPQFEIADHRSLEELAEVIVARGYEPVTHDWIDDER